MNGKRQANFELLRIVAMFMIITLHYLVKGSVAVPFAESDSGVNYFAWLIEAFCIVAVNCYVLISGYFMVESVWKPGRVVSLLCQVLFYALLIPCVMIGTGMTPGRNLGIYDWIACVLPIDRALLVCHIVSAIVSFCSFSGSRHPAVGETAASYCAWIAFMFLFPGKDHCSGEACDRSVRI